MSYNVISKSKDGFQSVNQEAVLDFVRNKLNYSLNPVYGSDNKFWLNGKYIDNKFCEMMEGSKYYQLIINRFDFGIKAGGDFNAWNVSNIIKQDIKEAINGKS